MPSRSSPTVKVFYLDSEAVLRSLREAAQRLAAEHPEVQEVVLFGSLARGDAVPGSDADLLILLRRTRLGFLERISTYTPKGCGIGVDIFPYTAKELRRIVRERPRFAQAIAEGVVLFRRRPEPSAAG